MKEERGVEIDVMKGGEEVESLFRKIAQANPEADAIRQTSFRGKVFPHVIIVNGLSNEEVEIPDETEGWEVDNNVDFWTEKAKEIEEVETKPAQLLISNWEEKMEKGLESPLIYVSKCPKCGSRYQHVNHKPLPHLAVVDCECGEQYEWRDEIQHVMISGNETWNEIKEMKKTFGELVDIADEKDLGVENSEVLNKLGKHIREVEKFYKEMNVHHVAEE